MQRIHISKHRQFDAKTGEHIPGQCLINRDSNLEKLMRAAKRGKLPEATLLAISMGNRSVRRRAHVFMHAHARRAAQDAARAAAQAVQS